MSPYVRMADVSPSGSSKEEVLELSSVRDMQVLARNRRLDLGLTQQETADRAEVSRKWLVNFESGNATAVELSLVLRLFAALAISLNASPASSADADTLDVQDDAGDRPIDLAKHLGDVTARSARVMEVAMLAEVLRVKGLEGFGRLPALEGFGRLSALEGLGEALRASLAPLAKQAAAAPTDSPNIRRPEIEAPVKGESPSVSSRNERATP